MFRYEGSKSAMSTERGCLKLVLAPLTTNDPTAEEPEDYIKAATVWSLGQVGRHTPEHAKAVAFASVLPRILECYKKTGG